MLAGRELCEVCMTEEMGRALMEEDSKSRLRRVIGEAGVEQLDAACVAVFGIGGVGSNCAEALVRGGVGTLVFVDRDVVVPSNINRQAVAFESTVGRAKVDVMAAMAHDINPGARVFTCQAFVLDGDPVGSGAAEEGFEHESVADVLRDVPRPDFIVDAIDTMTAKIALARYAQREGIPIISSMGGANKVDPMKLSFADLYETQNCPLCRKLRKQARKEGVESLLVLYSCEQPVRVAEAEGAERRDRTELGTMSYMPPIMGQMIAGYVIRRLLGMDVE